jgi:hypothetical protein
VRLAAAFRLSVAVTFRMTVLVGLVVVVAIALSPLYVRRLRVAGSARLGALLVVGAVGVASSSAAVGWSLPRDELFLAVFAALLVGALMILCDGPEDDPGDGAGGDPPWWPEFESDFGRYVRSSRRPLSRR